MFLSEIKRLIEPSRRPFLRERDLIGNKIRGRQGDNYLSLAGISVPDGKFYLRHLSLASIYYRGRHNTA
jgi:hypothetical protein